MADGTKDTLNTAFKLSPVAAAVVAALQPAGTALAQDNDEFVIDEIIVTATKREMNIQDLAQSISALTNEDIERQGLDSLEDIIRSIPSMTLSADLPGRNKIVFRGMNSGDGEYRTDSQAASYLDEIPMTSVSQQLSPRMVDIERVEALPGPQGTLFGASSQAGTIRYITNKPDASAFSGSIQASLGTTNGGDDSYDFSGHLNIPLSDSLAMRLVAYSVEEGGWIDNVYSESLTGYEDNTAWVEENFNTWEVAGGRFSVLADVNENWSVLLTAIAERSETNGSWDTDPELGDEQIAKFLDEFRVDEWNTIGLTIKGDLGFAELTSASAWVDRTITYEWDNHLYDSWKSAGANTYIYYDTGYYGYYYLGPLYNVDYILGNVRNDQKQSRFSQELRLTSTTDSRLSWMIGMFYEDVTDEWLWGGVTPGLVDTTAFYYAQYWAYYYNNYLGYDNTYPLPDTDNWWYQEYSRNVKQTAVFGELTFDVTDAWSVMVGGRWFENERDRYERNTWPRELPPFYSIADNGIDATKGTTSDTSFKLSTTYRFNDDNMAYVTVSEGFRLGGNNSRRSAESGYVNATYDPDTVTNYEIGNKSTFMNGRLRLNASAYLMKWDDIQLQRWDSGSLWWQNGTLNGGKGESKGLELEATAYIGDNLKIIASLSTGSAEYTEDIVFQGEIDTVAGTEMPFAPKTKYWVGIDYTIPDAMFGGDVWFRWDVSGQDKSKNGRSWTDYDDDGVPTFIESDELPGWNVSNATIGWQGESLQVNLRVNNVLDQKYMQSFSSGSNYAADFFPGTVGFRDFRTYNRPREIRLQMRKDF